MLPIAVMANIRPFRAVRPRPELASRIAAPPYDVLDSEEARLMARGNDLSFLHVNKAEIDFPPGTDAHSRQVYEKARANLASFVERGAMFREDGPRLYLYEQKMGDHVQAGFVVSASVDEYDAGLIKKHEHTKPDKVEDRARLIDVMDCQAEPVFLAFRARPELTGLIDEIRGAIPVYDLVTTDGIGHRVWILDDAQERAAIRGFAAVPALYVADGHHRSQSASRIREIRRDKNRAHTGQEPYNWLLAVVFPHDQLKIMDYNRVVKDLHQMSEDHFLGRVRERFDVSRASSPRPDAVHSFGMRLGGQWYRLVAKAGTFPADDPTRSLDVSILQENLLSPVLGIENPRTDPRIDFVGGIRGTGELEKRCSEGWAVAFAMFPTTLEQIFVVADAGEVMPPKSTWFEPKLRSGLLVRMLDG